MSSVDTIRAMRSYNLQQDLAAADRRLEVNRLADRHLHEEMAKAERSRVDKAHDINKLKGQNVDITV